MRELIILPLTLINEGEEMKIEPRGKYPGVKVHLDREEIEEINTLAANLAHMGGTQTNSQRWMIKLSKAITTLMGKMPHLLDERTEEEIIVELDRERLKSEAKLAAISAGEDWRKVKVAKHDQS